MKERCSSLERALKRPCITLEKMQFSAEQSDRKIALVHNNNNIVES